MDCTDNIEIKSLEGIGFDEAANAFRLAFADYDTSFSRSQLRSMLQRRGAVFALSGGAFCSGRLVSFIFNGIGYHNGLLTAYDTGTGTIPEFRRRGLTDRIFTGSLNALRGAGVKQYLLEVLTHNAAALKIYRRQGFEIAREFNCFTAPCDAITSSVSAPGITIEQVEAASLRQFEAFMEFSPSWQNSQASIERAGAAVHCFVARQDGCAVGFGATESAYGDIALIAVSPSHRRRGIGSALLARMASMSALPRVKVINVDARCGSLNSFLAAKGFTLSCTQYEMLLALS